VDDAARLIRLAERAAAEVQDGMKLGLGTGSTADAFLAALGKRVAAGLKVSGVPTSTRTAELATQLGIGLLKFDEVDQLDLGIDGADEIDADLSLVKGRGGALLYEKLVALICDRYLIIASAEKRVARLGTRLPLPVEVIPYGWRVTQARVRSLAGEPILRILGETPFKTDGGHFILDCKTGPILDPFSLDVALKEVTGVVDHGLFIGIATEAMVVDGDGDVAVLKPAPPPEDALATTPQRAQDAR
jgi:ribose 5-phosphate isomerase A